jgi:hypothetical protein
VRPDPYHVRIIQRDGGGQTSDDYHATVTRISDGTRLIFIAEWRWVLLWQVRRGALDRAFRRHDKRKRKLDKTEEFTR